MNFPCKHDSSIRFKSNPSHSQRTSTHKSGAVVVPDCLGVAEGLEDRVGLDDLVLQGGLPLHGLARGAHHGEIADHLFGVFSLAGAGLTTTRHNNYRYYKYYCHIKGKELCLRNKDGLILAL